LRPDELSLNGRADHMRKKDDSNHANNTILEKCAVYFLKNLSGDVGMRRYGNEWVIVIVE